MVHSPALPLAMLLCLARIATNVSATQAPVATTATPSSGNLLMNPAANDGLNGWTASAAAGIDDSGGNRTFIVRLGGVLQQAVDLPRGASGKFIVFIAYAFGERSEPRHDITDHPHLYGLTLDADRRRVLLYHQAETMRSSAWTPGQWGKLWGIWRLPPGADGVVFQMSQGRRRGTWSDGSVARFDDAGLFLFESRADAEAFVASYEK